MDCEHMLDLMQRYVDMDLSMEEEQQLHDHMNHCSQCATAFARLKALSDALDQLPKVTPKYSIVDAILPKLAEYDIQMQEREEGAALDQPAVPTHQDSRTRRFFSNFSWKIIGSVAVAACAILLFIFNGSGVPSESTFVAGETADNSQESIPLPSVAPSPEVRFLADQSVTVPDESPSKEKLDAPAEPEEEEPVSATKRPEVTVFTNNPAANDTATADDQLESSSADQSVDEDGPLNVVDSNHAEDQTESLDFSNEEEKMGMLGYEEESESVTPDMGHVTLADMKTSNDQYVAEVKDRKLIITSVATNEVVFNSTRQWSETEMIYSMGWTTDNKLYYEIADNDSIHAYLVDVQLRTELLIK